MSDVISKRTVVADSRREGKEMEMEMKRLARTRSGRVFAMIPYYTGTLLDGQVQEAGRGGAGLGKTE